MKRRATLALLLALVIALVLIQGAWASDYAGNTRSRGYGVKADISTPATAPYVGWAGQSNWVSTPGPSYWVQTGWRYYSGFPYARSYWEYRLPTGYHLEHMSYHVWNFTRNYEVSHSGSGYWTVKVNGASKGTWGPVAYPAEPVCALSESHWPTVELNTQFNNVKYRGHTTWFNFNEYGLIQDSPYWVSVTAPYKYRTQGP